MNRLVTEFLALVAKIRVTIVAGKEDLWRKISKQLD